MRSRSHDWRVPRGCEHEFVHYTLAKEVDGMGVVEWGPRTDCVLQPSVVCTGAEYVKADSPGCARYRCMGRSAAGSWNREMGPGRAPRPTSSAAASSGSVGGVKVPTTEELLWDVRSRSSLGARPSRVFMFVVDAKEGADPALCERNGTSSSLFRAFLANAKNEFEYHKYNAFVAFRNATEVRMPREGYAGAMKVFLKDGEKGEVRVGEGGVERKVQHGTMLNVDASSSLTITADSEAVGLILYTIRTESHAPALRDLGFPLRNDSFAPVKRGAAVTGRLSNADLTSHGYERKMLASLTEKCSDLGAICAYEQLEGSFVNASKLK